MPDPADQSPSGALRVALANGISHVVSEYTGRGPERARTILAGDAVIVLMHTTLSKGEQALVAEGRDDLVHDRRRADQHAFRKAASDVVSEVTGRAVVAFMSADHLDPPLALEFFLLEPAAKPA